ncbi:MFS transporter [Actinopolymorpha sp. NPDC004070]|uniref:MFS transporter n=1 Tax=Actinopolymorpha sp. NPDC004070 TaxID=3154548 RepID=UPI0033A147CA
MSFVDGFLDTRPLRSSPAFRRLWVGTTLSRLGGQLTMVAVLYQVWELTGSPAAVGLLGLVQAVPMVVFGLVGGSLADAVDRRRLVLVTTAGQLMVAGLLAVQAFTGLRSYAVLLVLVAAQSAGGALGAPAWRTFVPRLLPTEQVTAGVALFHVSFQLAMLGGPVLGGLVIAHAGVGVCYLVDAVTFLAALYGVRGLPAMRPVGTTARPGIRTVWEGWRFVASRPALGGAFLTDVFATVLAMPVALFPVVNAERFGGRPETLGLFFTAIAVGGVCAGAVSGRVTRSGRPGVVMLVTAAVWGVGLAGFGLAPYLWPGLGCLAVAGAADTFSVISRGSIVQLATPDSHRGRVSAVEHVIGVSGPDVGNFRAGLVGDLTSATFALVAGGLMCMAGVAGVAATNRSLRRFSSTTEVPENSEEGLRAAV